MTDKTQNIPTLAMLRTYRDAILALASEYHVSNVRVFGSVARDEATIESDIDLLVTAQKGVTVFDLVSLRLDLKDLLACEISLITDGIEDQQFLNRIQADIVQL